MAEFLRKMFVLSDVMKGIHIHTDKVLYENKQNKP